MDTVVLSRLQFALTSMFHFIFVPLTLGLSILIGIYGNALCQMGNGVHVPQNDEILGKTLSH